MKSIKWHKDQNGDLLAYGIVNGERIMLRVKSDNSYDLYSFSSSSPHATTLSASDAIKVAHGRGSTTTKALVEAEKAYMKYTGLDQWTPRLSYKKSRQGYMVTANFKLKKVELRYIEGHGDITSAEGTIPYTGSLKFGKEYTVAAFKNGRVVATVQI